MDILHHNDFDTLVAHRTPSCVSVYMPTFRTGSDALQNPVRLQNLLRRVEAKLVERGIRAPEARHYLASAQNLHDNASFWKSASDGLALFLSEASLQTYRVPLAFSELTVVGPRFHIKPLLPLLSPEGRFLILAVSANRVRLFEGSRWQTVPVDLATLPKNLVDALNYDQPEVVRHCHSAGPGSQFKSDLAFHGQGGAVDAAKPELREYFLRIDRALKKYLGDERSPLVFAGVDSLFPIYLQVNGYPNLQTAHIGGNTDLWSKAELHERAWSIVEPVFRQEEENALARCLEADGGPRGSHDLLPVLKAAHQGAVEALFVDPNRQQWGLFDADTGNLYLQDGQRPGIEELLDLAVSLTWSQRGKVYPIRAEQVPGNTGLAATFRYPLPAAAQKPDLASSH